MNSRRTRIYEGKAKILYEGPEPGTIIVHFKDDATAFNAQKKAVIEKVTQALTEAVGTPKEAVRVCIHDVPKENWGIAGVSAKDLGR